MMMINQPARRIVQWGSFLSSIALAFTLSAPLTAEDKWKDYENAQLGIHLQVKTGWSEVN